VSFAQNEGPVLDRALRILRDQDWAYGAWASKTSAVRHVGIKGGLNRTLEFLGRYRPERLVAGFSIDGRQFMATGVATVRSVENIGVRRLVALKTDTATFVCEGLASHNSCQVGPGGPNSASDAYNKAELIATGPALTYGYYQSWDQAQNAGTGDTPISNRVLQNRALAELTGFQQPPDFVTITVDSDVQLPFTYGDDFFLGDTVTVAAHKGYKNFQIDMRINSIGVSQIDDDGNCQLVITAVPYYTAVPATTGGN